MDWWNSIGASPLFALGAITMLTAYLLGRSVKRGRSSRPRNLVQDVQDDFRRTELSLHSEVLKLEVRLHEFSREIEGRLGTKMAVLDRLILEADREILQLNEALEARRREKEPPRHPEIPKTGGENHGESPRRDAA